MVVTLEMVIEEIDKSNSMIKGTGSDRYLVVVYAVAIIEVHYDPSMSDIGISSAYVVRRLWRVWIGEKVRHGLVIWSTRTIGGWYPRCLGRGGFRIVYAWSGRTSDVDACSWNVMRIFLSILVVRLSRIVLNLDVTLLRAYIECVSVTTKSCNVFRYRKCCWMDFFMGLHSSEAINLTTGCVSSHVNGFIRAWWVDLTKRNIECWFNLNPQEW